MASTELRETFFALFRNYVFNESEINTFWNEIVTSYSDKNRHYHNLNHLESVLTELTEVKGEIHDWQVLLFTLYYHDIIYNPTQFDNEETSATLAGERMQQIGVPYDKTGICKNQILATKSHTHTVDGDTNYFTDADLSILGQSWEAYSGYYKNIRKEFSIYPDVLYKAGRRKVLEHFLSMHRIFKTDHFFKKFEATARHNLEKEMQLLNDNGTWISNLR